MTHDNDLKSRVSLLSRPLSVTITSGKGGVGKSVVALSLAAECALGGIRTLLVDADLGLGNQHLFLDKSPIFTIDDVLDGTCRLREAVIKIRENLNLLPARSGFENPGFGCKLTVPGLRSELEWLEANFDVIVLDSGAGICPKVMTPCRLSDVVLVVTTPDVAAIADSYAVTKFQIRTNRASRIGFVVNRVGSEAEGRRTSDSLRAMTRRFLGYELPAPAIIRECGRLKANILSHSILDPGTEDDGWSGSIRGVSRMLADCLPGDLSLWAESRWRSVESLSPVNIGKKNDDTLNIAPRAGMNYALPERDLPTPRKDSL